MSSPAMTDRARPGDGGAPIRASEAGTPARGYGQRVPLTRRDIVLAAALIAAGGALTVALDSPLAVVCVACFLVGRRARSWPRAALVATLAVAAMTTANQLDRDLDYPLLDDLVFFALLLGAPAVLGQLLRRRTALITELAQRAAALRAARGEQAAAAVAEERASLAIALHDAVAHRVGEISLQAAGAERVAGEEPARAVQALARIEDGARAALDDIREVIGVLRRGDSELALTPPRTPAASVPAPWTQHGGEVQASPRPAAWRHGDALLAASVFFAIAIETLTSARLEGPAVANVAGAAAIAAPLIVRRQRPLAAATASYAAAGAQALLLTPPSLLVTPIVLLIVPPYSVGAHLPRRAAFGGLLVCAAGTVTVGPALPTVVIGLAAFAAGVAVRDRALRVDALRALNTELERARDAHAARARSEERLRIARELHDAVAHSMTVIVLQAGAAQRVWGSDPAAARTAVGALAEVARTTLAQLRITLHGAAPADPTPRLGGLDELIARVRPLGLDVVVTHEVAEMPAALDHVAYAVIQEALTNAVRHAAPTTVDIGLRRVGDELVVEVVDHGRAPGAVPPAATTGTGSGLRGMAERVAAGGGELRYGPVGSGFSVTARLPLVAAALA